MKIKGSSEFGRGGELNTIIGKGTSIVGDLKVTNSLRVDGKVKGNVQATDTVVVGKEGEVKGEIRAKSVFLAGKVNGNVFASGKVYLETKASIVGDISSACLVIHEGASFDGQSKMQREKNSQPNNREIKQNHEGD